MRKYRVKYKIVERCIITVQSHIYKVFSVSKYETSYAKFNSFKYSRRPYSNLQNSSWHRENKKVNTTTHTHTQREFLLNY